MQSLFYVTGKVETTRSVQESDCIFPKMFVVGSADVVGLYVVSRPVSVGPVLRDGRSQDHRLCPEKISYFPANVEVGTAYVVKRLRCEVAFFAKAVSC